MATRCDLARLQLLHNTRSIDFTLGAPDMTVQLNAYTVHVVPARIMQLLEWCDQNLTEFLRYSLGPGHTIVVWRGGKGEFYFLYIPLYKLHFPCF